MRRINLLIAILFFSYCSKAQSSYHFGLFPTIDHSGTLSDRLDYSLYYFGGFNLANSKIAGIKEDPNFFVLYLEQALTNKLDPYMSFTGSYAGIGFKTNKAGIFEAGPLYIFWVADKQNNLTNFYYLK